MTTLRILTEVITMLFIYSIAYKYFYVIIFSKAYLTFHQPREVKTNWHLDNKGIFKKVTKKQEHQRSKSTSERSTKCSNALAPLMAPHYPQVTYPLTCEVLGKNVPQTNSTNIRLGKEERGKKKKTKNLQSIWYDSIYKKLKTQK